MRTLLVVVGARPNFMKVARFKEVAARSGHFRVELVHTGQHSDDRMTTVFMDQFGLRPDHWLGIAPGSPNTQMAHIMLGLEPVVEGVRPQAMVVVGDVTGTLAAAITANKMGVPLVHLESGLRSGDRSMPEEVNRILTDRIADLHLVTEPSGVENLLREGADPGHIHLVGNTMIDTLVAFEPRVQADTVLADNGWGDGGHVLLTVHRPATVDDPAGLERLLGLIGTLTAHHRVIFPVHPRTRSNLERAGFMGRLEHDKGLHLAGPLDYFAFQRVLSTSAFVLTDSGGVQEEATYRGIPCLTLRPGTERPVTVTVGTNELVAFDAASVREVIGRIQDGTFKKGRIPDLWDGHATERVFEVLANAL